jgi:hypothetical protein
MDDTPLFDRSSNAEKPNINKLFEDFKWQTKC